MTDKDRGPAYAAEFALRSVLDLSAENDTWNYDFHGHKVELPRERKFASLESIAAYCAKVLELDAVRERWPNATVPKLVPAPYANSAHYSGGFKHEIAIPTTRSGKWALRELVVLHELAHSLARDGHGPRWRGAYLFLLETCMSPEIAMILGSYFWEECGAAHEAPKVRGLQSC